MAAIFFDFFGTLVRYSPSRTAQGYRRTAALVEEAGCSEPEERWLVHWDEAFLAVEREAERTGVEFSMHQAFAAFAPRVGLQGGDSVLADAFVATYLDEWNVGIAAIPGVPELLADLGAAGHTLAVVSNACHPPLVPDHLEALGIADAFAAVVTSIEVGWRKPRPEIFAAALAAVGATAEDAVFVGDNPVADYAGATAAGMAAWLVDPLGVAPPSVAGVPPERCLASVVDLRVPAAARN
jgi:putative hydrolase of the HAD superfamily